ncbi:MAG: hypothetical protein V4618_13540 [Pseudomonadota bacterium]
MNPIPYLMRRLSEKTTWASIAAAVTGAAMLATPYSYIVIGLGVCGVLAPSPGKKRDE